MKKSNKVEDIIRMACWKAFLKLGHITEEQYFNYLEREMVTQYLAYTTRAFKQDILINQVNQITGEVATPDMIKSGVALLKDEVPRLLIGIAEDFFKRDETPPGTKKEEKPAEQPKTTSPSDLGRTITNQAAGK
jgi:hypothetical protein